MSTSESKINTITTEAHQTLNNVKELARQVLEQRVVFFIGAGFSLDDEHVSTYKILFSLICRFLAMTDADLAENGSAKNGLAENSSALLQSSSVHASTAQSLREAFTSLFRCKLEEPFDPVQLKSDCGMLAQRYYEVNEWMVKTFQHLSSTWDLEDPDFFDQLQDIEQTYRKMIGDQQLLDFVKLDGQLLQHIEPDKRGKFIFIETVGLGKPEVMRSYCNDSGKSLGRHLSLGRLAAEGLLPVTLTTNYDMLLECGYQATGLKMQSPTAKNHQQLQDRHLPQQAITICSPIDFFYGAAQLHSAHIVKIHGCAQRYRDYCQQVKVSDQSDETALAKKKLNNYLNSIIYTYREIQHWRDDEWSKEFLHTLLRTRIMVFCGYSNGDPVLHNSIRNIYEEMARKNADLSSVDIDVPAYSTRLESGLEFNSLEILNAANRVADKPIFTDHNEHFLVHKINQKKSDETQTSQWYSLDILFRLLVHYVSRHLQQKILATELEHLVMVLFGKPKPSSELKQIRDQFAQLLKDEEQGWCNTEKTHHSVNHQSQPRSWLDYDEQLVVRQLAWTEIYYQQMLGFLQRNTENDLKIPENNPNYIPLRRDPLRSCFAILLELAMRQYFSSHCAKQKGFLRPKSGKVPQFELSINSQGPILIRILTHSQGESVQHHYQYTMIHDWPVDVKRQLWPDKQPRADHRHHLTPTSQDIWQLAMGFDIEGKWHG